ncbi:MAG: iron-containing redox enzyme family protein [Hydrogenophilus sp.]|nr:iron-containing redox enzyme family protein [Hydrogenophilus sp.]
MTLLEAEILRHPVFNEGFTRRLATLSHFPIEAAQRFALAYYPHILRTRRYQANALGLAEDEQIQFALAQILADEYGNGNEARTHMAMYRRFMRGVGVAEELIAAGGTLFPELRLYIDAMMAFTRTGDWLAAAAAVGIAMEWPIPHMYTEFLKGLRKIPGITDEALELFTEHVVLDIGHSRLMRDVLLPYAETPENQVRIRAGVFYNLEARWVMMQGLERVVFGTPSRP